jgi:hypothetical protein
MIAFAVESPNGGESVEAILFWQITRSPVLGPGSQLARRLPAERTSWRVRR